MQSFREILENTPELDKFIQEVFSEIKNNLFTKTEEKDFEPFLLTYDLPNCEQETVLNVLKYATKLFYNTEKEGLLFTIEGDKLKAEVDTVQLCLAVLRRYNKMLRLGSAEGLNLMETLGNSLAFHHQENSQEIRDILKNKFTQDGKIGVFLDVNDIYFQTDHWTMIIMPAPEGKVMVHMDEVLPDGKANRLFDLTMKDTDYIVGDKNYTQTLEILRQRKS